MKVVRNIGGVKCAVELGIPQQDLLIEKGKNLNVDKLNLPVFGSFEITGKCNLGCIHCYATTERSKPNLDTKTIYKIIDGVEKMGCLFLQLTGGECTSRQDFARIYRHAYKKGIILTISTNGSLIDDKLIRLWQKYPPYRIFVSLYGSNSWVHENVTKIAGSFDKTIEGITKLKKIGANVFINSLMMKNNVDDAKNIGRLAEKLGVKVFYYSNLIPRLNRDRSPIELMADKNLIKSNLPQSIGKNKMLGLKKKSVEQCLAGYNSFHIDCEGYLMPCKMVRKVRYKIENGEFENAWKDMSKDLINVRGAISKYCVIDGCEL